MLALLSADVEECAAMIIEVYYAGWCRQPMSNCTPRGSKAENRQLKMRGNLVDALLKRR